MADGDDDRTFRALAHRDRRRMLDILRARPGLSVGALAAEFSSSRIAVQKHLGVLQEAGLVASERRGRSRLLYLNAVPIQRIHERWTNHFSAAWAGAVADFQRNVEERHAGDVRDRKRRVHGADQGAD